MASEATDSNILALGYTGGIVFVYSTALRSHRFICSSRYLPSRRPRLVFGTPEDDGLAQSVAEYMEILKTEDPNIEPAEIMRRVEGVVIRDTAGGPDHIVRGVHDSDGIAILQLVEHHIPEVLEAVTDALSESLEIIKQPRKKDPNKKEQDKQQKFAQRDQQRAMRRQQRRR